MRLVLAVLVPVAVLGLLVTLILIVMRYRHRKRLEELRELCMRTSAVKKEVAEAAS